jgi:hypothetical protein
MLSVPLLHPASVTSTIVAVTTAHLVPLYRPLVRVRMSPPPPGCADRLQV